MISRTPIIPTRVRRITGQTFAFIPHRFLREGFFASLDAHERSLYLFLALASDRNGISFYHYDTICSVLGITLETYLQARSGLIRKDLLAFDGTRFQLLSLPPKPVAVAAPLTTEQDFEEHDPATIRHLILGSLASVKPNDP